MTTDLKRATLIMLFAMSLIPAGDAAGKVLTSAEVSPLFVAWSRFVLGLLMILPFAWRGSLPLFLDWRIWLRGALLAGGISSIQTALQTTALGDVFAAFFVGPMISYVLAGWLLGERMTLQHSLLVLLGFIGVLLVVRPGSGMTAGHGFALLAGIFYGAFLTASRWLSGVASPLPLTLTQLAVGAVILTPLGIRSIPALEFEVSLLTAASALFSMLGNLLLLYAYRIAPATTLAPMVYFQLIAAVLLGWVLFSDWPDVWAWTGVGAIIFAGVAAARLRT